MSNRDQKESSSSVTTNTTEKKAETIGKTKTKPIPAKRKTKTVPIKAGNENSPYQNLPCDSSQKQGQSKTGGSNISKNQSSYSRGISSSNGDNSGTNQGNPFYDEAIHEPKESADSPVEKSSAESIIPTTTGKGRHVSDLVSSIEEPQELSDTARSYENVLPKAILKEIPTTPPRPTPSPRLVQGVKHNDRTGTSSTRISSSDVCEYINKSENEASKNTIKKNEAGKGRKSSETGAERSCEKASQDDASAKMRKPLKRAEAFDVPLYDKPGPPRKVMDKDWTEETAKSMVDGSPGKRQEKESSGDEASFLNTVIVDKRYYDYMCQFRKEDVEPIQTICDIEINPVLDSRSNDVEIRFVDARVGSIDEWQRRLIEIYEHLKEELVIERVDLARIDNARAYRQDIESRHRCLFHTAGHGVEIICERRALDEIRTITSDHRVSSPKSRLALPVGYDIAGVFRVYLYVVDVATSLDVDIVAISTNDRLQHEFSVAKSLAEAAGSRLVEACQEHVQKANIQVSDVIRTTAGNLPFKAVLHAVEPRWPYCGDENAQNICRIQLLQMFENVFLAADKERCRSLAVYPVNSEQDNPPADVIAKVIKDTLLSLALKKKRPKFKEVHIVDTTDIVQTLITNELGEASRIRTNDGQYVAVAMLPKSVLARFAADASRQRMLIADSQPIANDLAMKRTSPVRKLLCGSKKRR